MAGTPVATLQLPLEGVGHSGTFPVEWAYFCKAKPGAHPHIDQLADPHPPAVKGTVDEFITANGSAPSLLRQMKNKVRKCACGKAVAYTLPFCNLCGASLASTPIGYTDNVFTGFIYGIEKCTFPLFISLRYQSPEFLVFDDLLSLSVCHLNVIPTTCYIPDWRFLLLRPKEGLQMINTMFSLCATVLKEQFISNPQLKAKYWPTASAEDILACVCPGFNIPPSQYQLHMQFIVPPFLPYQQLMLLKGNHFTKGRFFPLSYVQEVLALNQPMQVNDDTPLEAVIENYRAKGVDYEKIHLAFYKQTEERHLRLASWNLGDFEAVGLGDKVYDVKEGGKCEAAKEDGKTVQAADKLALQNYGRPYASGTSKPTGTYYKYPKKPSDVQAW
jgi:hypothetical protein